MILLLLLLKTIVLRDYLWKIHRRTTAPIIQLLNPWPRIRGIMMAGLLGPAMNATETVMASHAGNLRKDDPLQGDQVSRLEKNFLFF